MNVLHSVSNKFGTATVKNRLCVNLPRVMYVVALDPTSKHGSLENEIISLALAFDASGSLFYPLFSCPEGSNESTTFREAGIPLERLDLSTFRFSQLARLLRLISKLNITVVHWNFTNMLFNPYIWCLTLVRPKIKHFFTSHCSLSQSHQQSPGALKRFLKRLLSARYSKVSCVSQFVMDYLEAQGIGSGLTLCRHFVNTDRFRPSVLVRRKMRKQFEVEDRFVLLTVAHLIKEKGVDVVIRCLATLPENFVLWVVGDGPESNGLRKLASELNVMPRVQFHGMQKDVVPYMQAADCFVCASLWAEAAGLVNLEAAACGVPVIASRIGGIPEYVKERYTGFLFTPGEYRELARWIELLNGDLTLRQEMAQEGRDWTTKRFAEDKIVPEYLALYCG